ncbi:hypothetical protein MRX96_041457 [Rhipicephalus microplus]
MVAASALLVVLCAAAAAAVVATIDGVLVLGRDGRWRSDEPVPVGKQTSLLLLGSDLDYEAYCRLKAAGFLCLRKGEKWIHQGSAVSLTA